jgi:4-hydroxybenzoate polyprenyltransferase
MPNYQRVLQYIYLTRLHKPIGIFLLLWPTLWALWIAGRGQPNPSIALVFILGVILMRSAGCVMNDFADRQIDGHVQRTRTRPLATGHVKTMEALILASCLAMLAFLLVLTCNTLTIMLSFVGVILAIIYPFLKRVTHLPQLGLGLAFSWGVPMAFAAQTGQINRAAWFLFITAVVWPLIYDTIYAMVDREDDIRVGVKSTAVLLNAMDTLVLGLLQVLFVMMLFIVGLLYQLALPYYLSIFVTMIFFTYQQWLMKNRSPDQCWRAFLNNNWVGLVIFIGIVLSYAS